MRYKQIESQFSVLDIRRNMKQFDWREHFRSRIPIILFSGILAVAIHLIRSL